MASIDELFGPASPDSVVTLNRRDLEDFIKFKTIMDNHSPEFYEEWPQESVRLSRRELERLKNEKWATLLGGKHFHHVILGSRDGVYICNSCQTVKPYDHQPINLSCEECGSEMWYFKADAASQERYKPLGPDGPRIQS